MEEKIITLNLTRHQANQLYDLLEGLNYRGKKFYSECGLSFYEARSCVTDWYFADETEIQLFLNTIIKLLDNISD